MAAPLILIPIADIPARGTPIGLVKLGDGAEGSGGIGLTPPPSPTVIGDDGGGVDPTAIASLQAQIDELTARLDAASATGSCAGGVITIEMTI